MASKIASPFRGDLYNKLKCKRCAVPLVISISLLVKQLTYEVKLEVLNPGASGTEKIWAFSC